MANLNESQGGKAVKGRTKKSSPRVDLTAMVDLMFLLTTFFMLTTTLGQLNAADVAKPVDCDDCNEPYPESRTMTILLGKNNRAVSYIGLPATANMKISAVGEIDQEIRKYKTLVASIQASKHLIVIIKPTKHSVFKDFVDLVDEMKINNIKSYTIDDKNLQPQEEAFLKEKAL
ncbi:biopolymer transporter ExbD [Pedobacter sp. BMA]|uniref:biopolymer transporter ExbD n=1 Tax=Pedobacter sp. BMA TaxID=1663685 RepID=UPI0006495C1B|nr:biopolymer transporter ExbD [Pedobacter sp. BMA]KLT64129.1 hypothetical protein AB669_18905 [Pedobacter sp. BMA]